ncbi:Hypothetical predicted protein [Scomber scombrus]|uniref:Uncharacterized protein n=1 Tax=Scomber scombrus TaxID=13677 RepID=A0AAV1MV33_SCOSC
MCCVCLSNHFCVGNIPAEQIAASTPSENSMDTGRNSLQASHSHINTKKVTTAEEEEVPMLFDTTSYIFLQTSINLLKDMLYGFSAPKNKPDKLIKSVQQIDDVFIGGVSRSRERNVAFTELLAQLTRSSN